MARINDGLNSSIILKSGNFVQYRVLNLYLMIHLYQVPLSHRCGVYSTESAMENAHSYMKYNKPMGPRFKEVIEKL